MGKMKSKPAIVVAHPRAGGSWLMHCLSSHPEIFCPRGEPLLPESNFKREFPGATDTQILNCIGRLEMYSIGMAKVTYNQFTEEVEEWVGRNGAQVIHLYRENVVRVAVSQFITARAVTEKLDHAVHSYENQKPLQLEIAPEKLLSHCSFMANRRKSMSERLVKFSPLEVTYADMVGGEGKQSDQMSPEVCAKICDHLNITLYPMSARLKRVNAYPLSVLLENWEEVRAGIEKSPLRWCLKDEANFQ